MPSEPLRPMAGERQPERPIHPGATIGHVHLKMADLERALAFYCGVLGFALMQRYGTQAAFIAPGGYHPHIGLNTWESLGGSPPPPGSTGRRARRCAAAADGGGHPARWCLRPRCER